MLSVAILSAISLVFGLNIETYNQEFTVDSPSAAFVKFLDEYDKHYEMPELLERYENFKKTLEHVNNQNYKKTKSWTAKIYEHADLNEEEIKQRFPLNPMMAEIPKTLIKEKSQIFQGYDETYPPEQVDWVKSGAVTKVRNQGKCGSCWAFAAIGALESANFIATGNLLNLSEQELIDCDSNSLGCDGGHPYYAYTFIFNNGGVTSNKDYPYIGSAGQCTAKDSIVSIDSFFLVAPKSDEDLMKMVAAQPVAIALYCDPEFFLYSGGVMMNSDKCGIEGDLNHAVVLVGYGTDENGVDYWKIRNSWGDDWGEDGYVRIERAGTTGAFSCGVTKQATIPYV